jgi:hypothetical protein
MFGLTLIRTYELVLIGLVLITTLFIWWKARSSDFYWTDFKYAFPFFGTISRAIRRKDLSYDEKGLSPDERHLLVDYSSNISAIDRRRFKNAYTFLLLAKQADRRPAPVWTLPLLFILLTAEALGFSFLLAPFISAEITSNQAEVIGIIVAFVLAIIAAGLTHRAGEQMYESGLIKKMRRVAENQTPKVPLYAKQIENDVDQSLDEGQHDVTRFGNRVLDTVEDRGPKWAIIAAICYILAIAVVSTVVRYENLHLGLTEQSADQGSGSTAATNPFASAGNGDTSSLPPDVEKSAQAASQRVHSEETGERLLRGIAGIAGLGVIFVFTQVFSTSIGLQFGHLRRNRVKAAFENGTMGFSSYDDYEKNELAPKIRRAEMRLQQLRKGLYHDSQRSSSSMTFSDWLDQKMRDDRSRADEHRNYVPPVRSEPIRTEPSNQTFASPIKFDPHRLAMTILDIDDKEVRRSHLAGLKLSGSQMDQLKEAINAEKNKRATDAEKARTADTAWIDDI